ncbi:MAG TPA: VWA domain-containing protein [Thermoanaerobaculia bacterium]|nr:VWA domain-containing protein [Thermoanaerobaculia bacterium]
MRKLATGCALLVFSLAAAGQQISPLTERIDVTVINVDVTVTDRAGNPVAGLTRDDFEIFEDGRPQKITNFYIIQNAAVRSGAAAESASDSPQFRRKVVLMIDNNFILKPQRDLALKKIDDFFDKHFDGNYEWSVITVGHNVESIQPFTTDRTKIHAAIDHVRQMETFTLQPEMNRALLSDSTRKATMGDAASGFAYSNSVNFHSREQTMRMLQATTNTARAVIQMCRAFGSAGGKKIVILVTGGMERNTSFQAYETGEDRILQQMKFDASLTLDEMVHEANAANFNLYVVKASGRGMIAPQHDVSNKSSGLNLYSTNIFQQGGGAGPIDTSDVDSTSLTLALGTGGLYLTGTETGRNFERIDTDTSNYYSLGYSPQHPEDGDYHRITVKAKKAGLKIRHREGYASLSFEQRLEQTLIAPLTFQSERGSLPVTVEVGVPADADHVRVPVVAHLPMTRITVLPLGDAYVGRVHVYLSVYDSSGKNVGYHHLIKDVTVPKAELSKLGNAQFQYKMNVALAKGEFTLVVTLRDDVTNDIGTALENVRL